MSEVPNISTGVIIPKDGVQVSPEIHENIEKEQVVNVWNNQQASTIVDTDAVKEFAILADINAMSGLADEEEDLAVQKSSVFAGIMKFLKV